MKCQLKYFGLIKEVTKIDTEEIELISPNVTLTELIHFLEQKYSELKNIQYSIAVNLKIESNRQMTVNETDEIALLPAFSGG